MKFILLHEAKNDDGIRAFFNDVWELYVKVKFDFSGLILIVLTSSDYRQCWTRFILPIRQYGVQCLTHGSERALRNICELKNNKMLYGVNASRCRTIGNACTAQGCHGSSQLVLGHRGCVAHGYMGIKPLLLWSRLSWSLTSLSVNCLGGLFLVFYILFGSHKPLSSSYIKPYKKSPSFWLSHTSNRHICFFFPSGRHLA